MPNSDKLFKTRNIIDFDLSIEDEGSLWVGRTGKIGYTNDIENPNNIIQHGMQLHIKKKPCILDTTVVSLINGGSIIVGQEEVDHTASLSVWDSARLILRNLGVMTIDNKSEVNINKGGIINIGNGGKFELHAESVMHIYNGGKLVIDLGGKLIAEVKSKIYIHDGGTVHLLNGGILNLTEDAELIVEAHGKIIVDEGAILRLVDGVLTDDGRCKITVKDNGIFRYNGEWKHQGNGYIQLDHNSKLDIDVDKDFSARGFMKEVRFLRLNQYCHLNIICQGVSLGRGRIDMEPSSDITTEASIHLDSLGVQGTVGYAPQKNNAHGFITKGGIGNKVTTNFCNFKDIEAGIRSDVWAKLGLELLDIKRTVFTLVDYPVHMDGIIKAVFDSVYLISGKNSTLLYVDRADLSRVHVDNMEQGFNLVRVDYFVVRNSTFTHCIDGINAVGSSNVFAYQSSFNNNYRGIYMLGNGTSGMTELGCCNFYNNEYCIQGQDILLSISPLANNSGLGIVGKNKFTLANNSQLYFDVQYYYRLIDQIEGSYNYWGGSAPQAGNYALTRGGNDIPLIYTPYYTNPLTIVCNTAGGSGGNDMCPILDQVSGLSLPVIRALAMDDFHNSNTEDAETKMQWISNYQNQYYEYGTPYCRFQFDYARVFTKVDPPIIGQGQPIVTETGKHNLTKGLRLAPNPAKDLITIETESELERIEVFNSAGSLVSAQLCDGHIAKINCKEWPEGPYLIRAKCSNESIFSSQIISKE